ncbi:MAG TPA: riboflavin synthase [Cytophagaceae bacterium]|jgi:riboflavin synthase
MFTGIVETFGVVTDIVEDASNLHFYISSDLVSELKIDQSVSHNGACLTVVDVNKGHYKVTAINETLKKTNLGELKKGDYVNLERSMQLNGRLDGHIVQGHVDQIGICTKILNDEGSTIFTFQYEYSDNITVEKGSICVNGISLTVVDSGENEFSVAIIPYTWDNTNLKFLKVGDKVNLEFDIFGKYVKKYILKLNSK